MTRTARSRRVLLALMVVVAGCHAGVSTGAAPTPAQSPSRSSAANGSSSGSGSALPQGATLAMVKLGDSLFNNSRCAKCHGARGTGGDDGPRLDTGHWQQISGSLADIIKVTTDGAPGGAGIDMPPRGGTGFSDDQIKAVAAYVWTLSHH